MIILVILSIFWVFVYNKPIKKEGEKNDEFTK